jgi:hypothetical protein
VNHPLIASVIAGGPPQARSFVGVRPEGQLVLAALKPAGNPLAGGRMPSATVDDVVVRLYEATGQPARARLQLWAPVLGARDVNLLEQDLGDAPPELDLSGTAMIQRRLRLPAAPLTEPAAAAEPFQPVYSRYWLNNTGTAPIGNLPLSVYLDPVHPAVSGPVPLTVTVASDLHDERASGEVEMVVPQGWRCTPGTVTYDLEPGGHLVRQVVVTADDAARDGVYWVSGRIRAGGQTVQDVARLLVGVGAPETVQAVVRTELVRLRPGRNASIEVDLRSDAATDIAVQAQLISPWHTWELFPEANTGVRIPAGDQVRLSFPVRVPPGHRPGRWWALVKLAHAGQLHYSPAIVVEVMA